MRSPDVEQVKLAMSQSTTSGALAATAIDARGFGRAKFIFSFGTPGANAKINSSSVAVWAATGSRSSVVGAGTYVAVPSAYLSSMTTAAISQQLAVIDLAIPSDSHFLLLSGSVDSSSIPMQAVVELYEPVVAPPTLTPTYTVIVN
jgi:hypothetical protein